MIARFIGEDGSMGYRKGQEYELRLVSPGTIGVLAVQRTSDGGGLCPYGSEGAFLRNWEPLGWSYPGKSGDA